MNILPRVILGLFLLIAPTLARAEHDQILSDYIPTGTITRFEEPVRFWIGGKDRLEGKYYVETVVAEIRRILPHLDIREVSSIGQANVRFYLTDSHEEWQETITSSAEGLAGWQEMGQLIRGFTRTNSSPDGRIMRADIVLHLDFQTSGGQKLWVVRHELMHALGVMTHPVATTDTVLNSHQVQHEKNSNFSDADILVLRTMYKPTLSAGRSW
jgi:hypothetical protein